MIKSQRVCLIRCLFRRIIAVVYIVMPREDKGQESPSTSRISNFWMITWMLLVGADNVDSKQMKLILMSGEGRLWAGTLLCRRSSGGIWITSQLQRNCCLIMGEMWALCSWRRTSPRLGTCCQPIRSWLTPVVIITLFEVHCSSPEHRPRGWKLFHPCYSHHHKSLQRNHWNSEWSGSDKI